ncbi:MAG TPA: transposase [Candidatus Sulfotelmatobacter sp.]|nr:transposase [Candidatus Sulfotelmatobacter sp.]
MDDVNDDAKGEYRRIEVLTGPGRRRQWSASEKARIVAESLEPGRSVSEVARRWQICPQQLFGWRRSMRLDGAVSASGVEAGDVPAFVPIVAVEVSEKAAPIEIELAGAILRIRPETDVGLLTTVLRAVRSSSRRS